MTGVRIMRALTALALLVALLVGAGAGLLWVAQRPAFDFRVIEVRGDLRHVNAASVRAAVAGRLRGTFFTMRLEEARRTFERVPWVAGASVRRIWPGRLEVTLTEHRAVGVRDDGRLVSDAGALFVANPEEAEVYGPLVEFGGPDDPALAREAVQRLVQIGALLSPLEGQRVVRIEVSERRSWAVETASGLRIELGRDEPAGRINERLAAVVTAFPTVAATLHGAPTRIDLRYPNGFAAANPAVPQLLAASAAQAAAAARRKP